MSPASRSRTFCILAWILTLLVPLLILTAIFAPWASKMAELDARIATSQDQLVRFRRLIQSRPVLEAELEQVRSNDAFKAFYFNAPTQALAGAELQSQVQNIVNVAQGRLISTQLLPQEKGADPPRVRVRTQIQGTSESLLEILYQIEQARPFLFVERLSVRSSARPSLPNRGVGRRPTRRIPVRPAGELTLRIDIFGYALGGGA